ncbi:MAG: cob(I)yrinic acid a,c-diamide adenosyltransferase [Candidatus Zixiibacteriota bacterium]
MKIYTKTGDGGETGLWGGTRVGKDNARIHAYGTVDECNAILGVARTFGAPAEFDARLERLQNILFIVGADLATPSDATTAIDRISPADTALLESWIDDYEAELPKLKQFILPGGKELAAYLHLARTVCRRAERWVVELAGQENINPDALTFLNRLSDFLFVAARMANHQSGVNDIPWDNPRLKNK